MGTPRARVTMARGGVENLLGLIDLHRAVPDFSTLSRRQKTLKVNIPYRGSEGPRHLPIDIEPVSATGSSEPARGGKVEGEGEWSEADQRAVGIIPRRSVTGTPRAVKPFRTAALTWNSAT